MPIICGAMASPKLSRMTHRNVLRYSPGESALKPPGASGKHKAFTFIEVMIVLTILAIAVVLAVPMFSQTDVSKLRGAARLLQADLGFAQIESVSHGDDPRVMVFDTVNHRYHIAAASDSATPITNPADGAPYVLEFGLGRAAGMDGVTISSLSVGGDDQLQFGIYGELDQSTPATMTLSLGGKSVTITVDPDTGDTSVSDIN